MLTAICFVQDIRFAAEAHTTLETRLREQESPIPFPCLSCEVSGLPKSAAIEWKFTFARKGTSFTYFNHEYCASGTTWQGAMMVEAEKIEDDGDSLTRETRSFFGTVSISDTCQ